MRVSAACSGLKKRAADPTVRRPSVLKPERLGTGTTRFRSPSVGPRGPLSRDRRCLPFGCLSVSGRVAPSAPRVRGLSGRTSSRPGDSSGKRRGSQGIVARSKSAGNGARHVPVVANLVLVLSALAAAPIAASADAVADLHALFDREWERDLADNPLSATYSATHATTTGCRTFPRPPEQRGTRPIRKSSMKSPTFRASSCRPLDQLDYDLFRHEYETRKAAVPFHARVLLDRGERRTTVAGRDSPSSCPSRRAPIRRPGSAACRRSRHSSTSTGTPAPRGRREARPAAGRHGTRAGAAGETHNGQPEDSPFFELPSYPSSIPVADRKRLTARSEGRSISQSMIPAYRRFQAVFRDEYLPATRESRSGSGTRRTGARTISTSRASTRPPR